MCQIFNFWIKKIDFFLDRIKKLWKNAVFIPQKYPNKTFLYVSYSKNYCIQINLKSILNTVAFEYSRKSKIFKNTK